MGKNTVETKAWLDKCYPGSSAGKSTIIDRFADFKRGRTNVEGAPRPGRPKEDVNPENIIKVNTIVIENRKVKLDDIADTLNISKERVGFILHEHLFMRKLFSKNIGQKREISVETRAVIITLHAEGYSSRQIASKANVSQTTVVRTLQRTKETGQNKSRQ
nr:uncharacterized protein LOC107441469 [Parasteatoda tepidariorum]